jgi:predicted GIY-YIG superfamily endonuclease
MPQSLSWTECQKRSDELLGEGLWKLRSQPVVACREVSTQECGNYLLSLDGKPRYIGEACDIRARLRLQFKAKTSTFYKSYLQSGGVSPIENFRVQVIQTEIGRKEIEEFGIVNASCNLNKFQLGKRNRCVPADQGDLWEVAQTIFTLLIEQGSNIAISIPAVEGRHARPVACPGIYVVRDPSTNAILYIGESSDLAERWFKAHRRSTYFSALRRHVAVAMLGLSLKVRNGKAKYLEEAEESAVSEFLDSALYAHYEVSFGRYELEEHLIRTHSPALNRKGNKNT